MEGAEIECLEELQLVEMNIAVPLTATAARISP